MSIFSRFERKESKVVLSIDSSLNVHAHVYPLAWECNDPNYAELLKNQFNNQFLEYKKEIARKALHYLDRSEISEMKKELKSWNSKTHHWK